ncbi:MAG: hypothetical protein IPP79_12575 [Chitinophagaceae bacterium]|nr:hypothetical protein [Chitinophagaceae bacterium]
MKYIICLLFGMMALDGFSQNVGVGTVTPVTKLDVASGNNWDLVNGEGDMRVGNATYRLKFGLALGGSGAGAAGIMQFGAPGGYNVLSLGAQGVNLLQLNGNLGRLGMGTDNPSGKLEIYSGPGVPQQVLTQTSTGDFSRIRFRNGNSLVNTRFWDAAAFIAPTGAVDDRLNFFSPVGGNILGLSGTGAVYFNGNAGNAGQVLKSNGAAGAAVWTEPETMYTAVPNPSPYVMMLDNIPGYVYANVSHTINLNVPSTVLISASFNADVTLCAFCGAGVNQITLIIDGTELTNKPFFLTAPSGGLTNVTISNYPISMAAGQHTIQFKANHITPSTNTGVQAIYSTVIVKPN